MREDLSRNYLIFGPLKGLGTLVTSATFSEDAAERKVGNEFSHSNLVGTFSGFGAFTMSSTLEGTGRFPSLLTT